MFKVFQNWNNVVTMELMNSTKAQNPRHYGGAHSA